MAEKYRLDSQANVFIVFEESDNGRQSVVEITEDRKTAGSYLGIDQYTVVQLNGRIVTQLL